MKQKNFLWTILTLVTAFSFAQQSQKITVKNVPKFETEITKISKTSGINYLKQRVKASNVEDFKIVKSYNDDLGFEHIRVQQTYKNIPVVFGEYVLHTKHNQLKSFNGDYFTIGNLNVQPTLSKSEAFNKAINYVNAQSYMWENTKEASLMNYSKPEGELVILPALNQKDSKVQTQPKLAYRFDIYATKPVSRAFIYIDANTGEFLYKDNIIAHVKADGSANANGTAATRYSGTKTIQTDSFNGSYRLRDYTRGNGIETYDMNTGTNYNSAVDFTDNDNNWTAAEYNNSAKDNAALDAHYGAEMTYDYWMTKHNRNSYDGNGAKIKSYVHYDVAYDNAYWNGSVMTYGDGSGTYFDALTSLDVAGHEIGHAVCSNTANLTYSYESGAMNEGFSDIWGASIEYFAEPTKQTWLIGEDIERRSGHAALRSMSDPKSEGQPDTYQGTNWATGSTDNGGVHTNSGVLNYWYYLLSVGGSGTNDNGDAYNVTGITIDKAGKIAYRAESVYLTSSSNYAAMRTAGIQSAVDLYGAGSAEEIATTNAFYAVGIGAAYNSGGGTSNYCTSKGNSVADEYIGRVQLNTIDKSSNGGNGYSDYTSISTDLTIGTNYTIIVTPTWTATKYNEAEAVWIDYNADGDFADAGELVWSAAASQTSPVSGNFTVPSTATVGATRMRVSMKYNGIPTPCETFSYGEVEDYTVNLVNSTVDTQAPSAPTNLVASNATQTTVDLAWTAATDNVGVTGYDVYKNGTLLGSTVNTSTQVTGLTANTTYNFYVKAKDAAGNVSGASNTVSVTTQAVPSSSCTAQVSAFPYNESFENTLGLWSQASGDDFDWTVKSGSTPSSNTGPSSATDGSYYVYMESSSPNYSTKRAILNSPCFDLSGETQAIATFKYHMYGASTMGSLALEASTDNGATWTSVWSKSGNQGNSWLTVNVDLGAYLGATVKLRFNGVTGTTWQGDMAVDAFSLSGGSTGGGACTATTLTITFDDYPAETSWDIKDANGTIVFSGGTYGSQAKRSTITLPNCIDTGCYTFNMHDSYGDGMCCSYGNGSFSLTEDATGTVLASGGSFTSVSTTNFCVGGAAVYGIANVEDTNNNLMDEVSIYPNPAKNSIKIALRDERMKTFVIVNVIGQNALQGEITDKVIDIASLKQGIYLIKFNSDKKQIIRRFIKE